MDITMSTKPVTLPESLTAAKSATRRTNPNGTPEYFKARLTLARKIASISLTMWKKGASFDPKQLQRRM
jgi:hypothetical protein